MNGPRPGDDAAPLAGGAGVNTLTCTKRIGPREDKDSSRFESTWTQVVRGGDRDGL